MTENIETPEIDEDVTEKEIVKSNPYAMFNMDECAETGGIWVDYGAFRVMVARMGGKNTMYNKEMMKLGKKYSAASLKRMDEDKSAKILNELYVKTLVKKWQVWEAETESWVDGLHDFPTGDVVPADFKSILNVFSNLSELRRDLLVNAENKDNFLKEEVIKN